VIRSGLLQQVTDVISRSGFAVVIFLGLTLTGNCGALPSLGTTPLKADNFSALQAYLFANKPDLGQFRLRGPFPVTEKEDFELRLSAKERIKTDLYLSAHGAKAPLAIFMHGYGSTKQDHRYQAMHLASWGVHSLVLDLPAQSAWVGNGRGLAKVVKFIQSSPGVIDNGVDANKIVLIGHSFGAYSVTVALASGAKVSGAVLLDPATADSRSPSYLGRVTVPVIVLGADENIASTRNRDYFYRYIKRGVAEVSIKGANHEDAQFPSHFPETTEAFQFTFAGALTAAAIGFSGGKRNDYAMASFGTAIASGDLFNARKK
jgi:pimeloyl-ACP methyl ester carboxylesterase